MGDVRLTRSQFSHEQLSLLGMAPIVLRAREGYVCVRTSYSGHTLMPKLRDGNYEQRIAAELRELTQQTRKLREELRAMLATKTSGDAMKAQRVESWPKERRHRNIKRDQPDRRQSSKGRS